MKTIKIISLIALICIIASQLKAQEVKVKKPVEFQKHKIGLYCGVATTAAAFDKITEDEGYFGVNPIKGLSYSYSFTKNISFVFDVEKSVLAGANNIVNKAPVINTLSTGFKLNMLAKRRIQPNIFIAGCRSVLRDRRSSSSKVISSYLQGFNLGCGLDLQFSKRVGAFVHSKVQFLYGGNLNSESSNSYNSLAIAVSVPTEAGILIKF